MDKVQAGLAKGQHNTGLPLVSHHGAIYNVVNIVQGCHRNFGQGSLFSCNLLEPGLERRDKTSEDDWVHFLLWSCGDGSRQMEALEYVYTSFLVRASSASTTQQEYTNDAW